MRALKAFFFFWIDFIVGDDWVVAVGVVVALGATRVLVAQRINAWWLMGGAVVLLLALSVWRELKKTRT